TRFSRDWSSDVCSSDLHDIEPGIASTQSRINIVLLQALDLVFVGFVVVGDTRAVRDRREVGVILARTAGDGAGLKARSVDTGVRSEERRVGEVSRGAWR